MADKKKTQKTNLHDLKVLTDDLLEGVSNSRCENCHLTANEKHSEELRAELIKVLEELTILNSRVESLDEKQDVLRSGMEDRWSHIEKKLEKINELLMGNGTPERGLVVRVDRLERSNVEDLDIRVDRLEQNESKRTWLLRACVVACLGAIGAALASYFKN
mgnify:CR=1 FL=1